MEAWAPSSRPTLAGVAAGAVTVFALRRVIASLLYSAVRLDPLEVVGVALLLIVVSLAAAYLPARRALRIDAATVLRQE